MFNKDFYPTPQSVIDQMTVGLDLRDKLVLEPSAGKGNIVEYLKKLGADVSVCEKNKDLADIVSKKARFLKPNFLDLQPEDTSHFDFIIMNPPFSEDDKHILHAWEVAPPACTVIALCNQETINNTYTSNRRQLSQVIAKNGSVTPLGDCFRESERTTGVNVAMVTLYKTGTKDDFGDFFDMSEDEERADIEGVVSYNAVRDIVGRYVGACKLYEKTLQNAIDMNNIAGQLGVKEVSFTCTVEQKPHKKEDFMKGLQKNAWMWIFKKMNMDKYMTESLRKDINKFVETQYKVPFTMKNIYKMIDLVVATHGQRMDRVYIELFDKVTERHKENRYELEGWKTNSHYLVNQKFIVPNVSEIGWHGELKIRYNYNGELITDFVKALEYLTGERFKSNNLYQAVSNWNSTKKGNEPSISFGQWFDFAFFEIKCFKKGTAHIKFKNKDVWALFNQKVAEIKGFPLPEAL